MGWRRFWRRFDQNIIDPVKEIFSPTVPDLPPIADIPESAPGPAEADLQRIRKSRQLRASNAGRIGTILGGGLGTFDSGRLGALGAGTAENSILGM